ncbi:MAG: GAF domain-containing protein [Ignavibacteria bacterium]|jgi:diguanylate cyclase (GGDEF)-like protein|nr:GAF domain-containing protein [Ignavibacteria bacterium]
MKKTQYKLKELLAPRDVFILLVILLGLFFLVILSEIEVKLIGASIAVLGIIFFAIDISNRIKNYIGLAKPGEKPPDFEIDEVKKDGVVRIIYKDYKNSFGDSKDYIEDREEKVEKAKNEENVLVKESVIKQAKFKDRSDESFQADEDLSYDDGEVTIITKVSPKPVAAYVAKDSETAQGQKEKLTEKDVQDAGIPEKNEEQEQGNCNAHLSSIRIQKEEKASETEEPKEIDSKSEEKVEEKPSSPYKKSKIDVPASLYKDDSALGNEPLEALQFLLNRILTIIRSITNTKTAVFLLVDQVKNNFLIISSVSDNQDRLRKDKLIPIGLDIISQIYKGASPEIITEINISPIKDLIPYYDEDTEIGSFIGVPVFYGKSVHGILCADSEMSNAYTTVTVNFLGHFTRIISALFKNYLEKHDLSQSQKLLDAIHLFGKKTQQNYSQQSISDSLSEVLCHLLEYTSIGVCLMDFDCNSFVISTYISRSDSAVNIAKNKVNLDNSLIAPSILESQTVLYNDLSDQYLRVCDAEYSINTNYSFLSVPIRTNTNSYGAIFLEASDGKAISQNTVSILETLARQSATAIESVFYDNYIENSQLIDPNTGILNYTAFMRRFNEELERSRAFGIESYLCIFQLDKYSSLDPEHYSDRLQKAIFQVLKIAREQIKIFDLLGKMTDNVFAIALFGDSPQDARIWAERLRTEVALAVLDINSQRFTVTISIGLTQVRANDSIKNVFDKASKALFMSAEKTNAITVL